jgi:hypothetical protein
MDCTSLGRKRNEELVLDLSNSLVPPKPTPSGYLPDAVYPRYELAFITYGIMSQGSFPITFAVDDRTWREELARARADLEQARSAIVQLCDLLIAKVESDRRSAATLDQLAVAPTVGTCSLAQVDPTGGGGEGEIAQTGFMHVMAKSLLI